MVCPSEVLFDLTPIADIIVGDYNYIFDPSVYLRRLFFKKEHSDWILIIDEAHNLYQRGMDYFSPEIRSKDIETVKKLHKIRKSAIYKNIIKSLNDFLNLFKDLPACSSETRVPRPEIILTKPSASRLKRILRRALRLIP